MVRLENIRKSFGGSSILKGINLGVDKGEVLVIIGPSGSGKTTLLRCLNYLESPDSGTVTIGEQTVKAGQHSKKEILDLRKKSAMIFQNYNLFKNKTALGNVMEGLLVSKKIGRAAAEEISLHFLEKVGLSDKKDYYPDQLSGGQQQRVGIARALALNPDVILLDEPTSALDPELVGEVLDVIKKISKEGITMVIVTHEMKFAREVASRVAFMEGGAVIEEGPPEVMFFQPREERTRRFLKNTIRELEYSI
jgi:L-cystine transport system ATP-binding protein